MEKTAFGSFGYSSGESIAATSDVQNVDFGVGACPSKSYFATVKGSDNDGTLQTFNSTPENITSDFGVVNYPFGIPKGVKKEVLIPAAISQPGKGAGQTAGHMRGVYGGGNMRSSAVVPRDALMTLTGTLERQNESRVTRDYVGQLGE